MDDFDLLAELPYGPEFHFVDRVICCSPQGEIITEKTFHSTHPILRDHFIQGPTIVPGVLLIEMACQSALLWAIRLKKLDAGSRLLIGLTKATFHQQAPGGTTITARVKVDDPAGGFAFKADLVSEGTVLARVQGIGSELRASDVTKQNR